jgi:hypothetical protein
MTHGKKPPILISFLTTIFKLGKTIEKFQVGTDKNDEGRDSCFVNEPLAQVKTEITLVRKDFKNSNESRGHN